MRMHKQQLSATTWINLTDIKSGKGRHVKEYLLWIHLCKVQK